MKGRMNDFTEGNIPKHLLSFSIPLFLGNLFQALYNTVDSFWVGQYIGVEALGAVGVSFPIIFALVSLMLGIGVAVTALVSQYAGAKEWGMVRKVTSNSLMLLVFASLVFTVIGVAFRETFLRLINTPADIFDMASSYLGIFFLGMTFTFIYNAVSAILRGLGDSRSPVIYLVIATVINIILDPLFIIGFGPFPKMGVAGVAVATVIAQAVSAVLGLYHLYKVNGLISMRSEDWKLDGNLLGKVFKIGLPSGIQQVAVAFSSLAVSSIVNSFGSSVVAAYTAAVRLDQFSFMPAMSVSLAVAALAGQNLGAGKDERVRDILKWSIILVTSITSVVSLVVLLVPEQLIKIFTDDPRVLKTGAEYLRIVGLSYVPFAIMFSINGLLRGAGDTFTNMLFTLLTLWIVRVPLARYLSLIPSLGSKGIWMAIAASPVVGVLVTWLYYRSGVWKKRVAIRRFVE